jgi:SsrA-binding protein
MGLPVIENRKARHNFHVLETYELGVALKGTEVKSIRWGKLALAEAFVAVRGGELYLVNAHVDPYEKGNVFNHAPLRERKLLAHRREIREMDESVSRKGLTLIPLKAYFKGDVLKLQVAVCKGKAAHDKRADKAKQEAQREIARALRASNR